MVPKTRNINIRAALEFFFGKLKPRRSLSAEIGGPILMSAVILGDKQHGHAPKPFNQIQATVDDGGGSFSQGYKELR